MLLYIGFSGWLIGGIAAALDAFIPFNFRLHNTLWVPGHFHTYFIIGVIPFLFGFVTHLLEEAAEQESSVATRAWVIGLILAGGYGLVSMWLLGGLLGLPRRYAVQAPGGANLGGAAVICVLILILGFLLLLIEWGRLLRGARRLPLDKRATPADRTLANWLRVEGFRRVS
jgi:cytochrome c oxidase subunit 1